jgi:hypothetical protein
LGVTYVGSVRVGASERVDVVRVAGAGVGAVVGTGVGARVGTGVGARVGAGVGAAAMDISAQL